MHSGIFSDRIAQRNNFLTTIDARVKMVFVLTAIILCITSTKIHSGIMLACIMIMALVIVRVPLLLIAMRMLAPISIAGVVVVLQSFTQGTIPIFEVRFFDYAITCRAEGLFVGLLIAAKVLGSVSAIIFLSFTTPMNKLMHAASFFKIPHVFVEIVLLSYRYVFVLCEDAITVMHAQRVRLGYSGYLKSVHSFGQLAGAIVIRAYDQSIATYESMEMRGFSETTVLPKVRNSLQIGDWLAMIVFLCVWGVLLFI